MNKVGEWAGIFALRWSALLCCWEGTLLPGVVLSPRGSPVAFVVVLLFFVDVVVIVEGASFGGWRSTG
jgi:hypothetical protein